MSEETRSLQPVLCAKCGSGCCVCDDDYNGVSLWAAHCMGCDNSIGEKGLYDPCAKSKYEATMRWNAMNERIKSDILNT